MGFNNFSNVAIVIKTLISGICNFLNVFIKKYIEAIYPDHKI